MRAMEKLDRELYSILARHFEVHYNPQIDTKLNSTDRLKQAFSQLLKDPELLEGWLNSLYTSDDSPEVREIMNPLEAINGFIDWLATELDGREG
jgi:hypothetical protein